MGFGEDPADGSCPSVGGTETVRDPREESRYGADAVHAGLSVGTVALSAALSARAAAMRAGLFVEAGMLPEWQILPRQERVTSNACSAEM